MFNSFRYLATVLLASLMPFRASMSVMSWSDIAFVSFSMISLITCFTPPLEKREPPEPEPDMLFVKK